MDSAKGEAGTDTTANLPTKTDENHVPDPRWPYLSRWSPNPIRISSPSVKPNEPEAELISNQSSASPEDAQVVVSLSQPDKPSAVVSGVAANTVSYDFDHSPSFCSAKGVDNMRSDEMHKSFQVPPLQGAWANKLNLEDVSANPPIYNSGDVSMWPSLDETKAICFQKGITRHSFKPVTLEDNQRFPWAAKMNHSSRNLYRAAEPKYLEDGTPKVTIPREVLLQGIENQKDYILGQFYRCSPPSGGLIYAVFNKLWGRNCRITIRKLSDSTYLFHVPDEASRNWVLQRGLWHVDDCLMFVAPWTPKATLDIPEIKTIPVWLTLKRIPSILYSIPGISHIASGLGAPMATHKAWLDPFNMGEAKILVEVELSKGFPSRIAAEDESGFISMVDVEYAWLPAKCSKCGQLGHKVKRCLQLDGSNTVVVNKTTESETKVDLEVGGQSSASLENGDCSQATPAAKISGSEPPSSVQIQANSSDKCSESVKSSPRTAKVVSANTNVPTNDDEKINRESEKRLESGLRSNKFASLSYSEGDEPSSESQEEQSESEDEKSMSNDLMTHLEQRILRERPVIPSTKAKEMVWQTVSRGRGYQSGRGNQRGRGNREGRGNRGGCG